MRSVVFALLACVVAVPARAQFVPAPPAPEAEPVEEVSLSGPRFGVTHLSDGVVRTLRNDYHITVGSVVTQFGWQFERHLYRGANITALTEWIVLVGGLEQGTALPSGSWLVGLRARNGLEVGVGPNLTPAGPALAIAAGVTFGMGPLKVPVNIAYVPSRSGTRISVLTGFNTRRN